MKTSRGIPAGRLRNRVDVRMLKEGLKVDAGGHIDKTKDDNFRVIARRSCELVPRGSREFFRGEQVAADITHQVNMTYDSESAAFTTEMHLILRETKLNKNRQLNISEPPRIVGEQGRVLAFACTEVK